MSNGIKYSLIVNLSGNLNNGLDYIKTKFIKSLPYILFISSMSINLLFTIGGALFAIPAVCNLLGIGMAGKLLIGLVATFGAYWGTFKTQGFALSRLISESFGLDKDIIPNNKAKDKPGILKKFFIYSMLTSLLMFHISGGYFGGLYLLSLVSLQFNPLAGAAALVLSMLNAASMFALSGMAIYNSEMGHISSPKKPVDNKVDLSQISHLNMDADQIPKLESAFVSESGNTQYKGLRLLAFAATNQGLSSYSSDEPTCPKEHTKGKMHKI